MVDTVALDAKITASGKKMSYLAKKMGITINTLRRKRTNMNEFNSSEVDILCDELDITKLTEKQAIFFAPNVEIKKQE